MPRYRLTLEYDGRPFQGWQAQANGPSVQATLEAAIAAFAGETVRVHGAGRTDTGVHALGQVAHVDLGRAWPAGTAQNALNAHLAGKGVVVLRAQAVDGGFHARFSAIGRRYVYTILNRRAPCALDAGRVWHVPRPLDAELMHEAAQALVGRHDFTSFRSAACQAMSPVKTLDRLCVTRQGETIHIEAAARSFLHHQVRNMVGSLRLVGEGRWPVDGMARALAARDRAAAGPTAPPDGLYLVGVAYPGEGAP
ncbi:tRNA pseudouridine(38-40) synthase TruA [Marinivivus vitaminiproducens]|uniref:tRNA pseudouridine(38-40) synthase TruA n=1 Tax=Marinivivus vitaminiproducens TaxID=3035935 RepID=UPI0027A5C311|nr:tRNA pseudouridine(38-40) synthase TruA [Geminicoccaceae bacterium SCSIO 64248]